MLTSTTKKLLFTAHSGTVNDEPVEASIFDKFPLIVTSTSIEWSLSSEKIFLNKLLVSERLEISSELP